MRKEVTFYDVYEETIKELDGNGLLLVAGDPPNPMTIGWGTIGIIWHKPVFTVLVRPTRFTYQMMESAKFFTVNVLAGQYKKELAFCGSRSGRDINKVMECGFTMKKGICTDSYYIAQSHIHFECSIAHKHRLDPAALDPLIINRYYPLKDFHMVYYGEVVGVFRKDNG